MFVPNLQKCIERNQTLDSETHWLNACKVPVQDLPKELSKENEKERRHLPVQVLLV